MIIKMKKKLLFLTRSLGKTGVPVFLRCILNGLDLNEYDVTIGVEFEKDVTQLKYLKNHFNIIFYNSSYYKNKIDKTIEKLNTKFSKSRFLLIIWKFTNQLLKLLEKRRVRKLFSDRFDCGIAFHQGKASKYLKYYIKAGKKIYFYHASYPMVDCKEKYFINADKMIFVSKRAQQAVLSKWKKINKFKCEVITPIIDEFVLKNLSKEQTFCSFKPNSFKLLTVGRLVNDKGYDLLIKTSVLLKKSFDRFEWFVVGDGPLYNTLLEDIYKNHLEDNVKLLGALENPYPFFSSCDLYVSPSKFEPFGIVLLEATIFGKPFIATKTDGALEQIENGQPGILSDLNEHELSTKILKFFSDLSNGHYKTPLEFNYGVYKSHVVKKILELFDD